jgi:hypothetical protein
MLTLDKHDKAMIREAGRGFEGAAFLNFEDGVIARLQAQLDSGVIHAITRNHVRAACNAELATGK